MMSKNGFSPIYLILGGLLLIGTILIFKSVSKPNPPQAAIQKEAIFINTARLEKDRVYWSSAGNNFSAQIPPGLKLVNVRDYSEDMFELGLGEDIYSYYIIFNQRQPAGFAEGDSTAHCDEPKDKEFNKNIYTEKRCFLGDELRLVIYTPTWNDKLGRIEVSLKEAKFQDQALPAVEQVLNTLQKESTNTP